MTVYITFLRGINISGKNKVPMAELKKLFEGLGFTDVKTYLNSGNVVFSSDCEIVEIQKKIKDALASGFDFDIPFFLIQKTDLDDIVAHAPQWWGSGDKAVYDNLIFMMDDMSFEKLTAAVGDIKPEIEKIEPYKNAVF